MTDVSPLITIGITCYNAKKTIGRAVKSALAQRWANREILVVDDGSKDNTRDILQALQTGHTDIRIICHQSNRGCAEARNTLLSEARGEFVAFFDDDDESVPERIRRQYERIVAYEAKHGTSQVFCYSNRNVVRANETAPSFQRLGIGRRAPEPSGSDVADYILGLSRGDQLHSWGMLGSCTLMARTKLFRKFNGFDGQFRRGAELDFAVRAAFGGAHFISVDDPLITQYLTAREEKAGDADLRYRLLLLKKHKTYVKGRRAYSGAVANMRAWFHHSRGHYWRGRFWRTLALLLFPPSISLKWASARAAQAKKTMAV
jgi:glycosyltransferase involved in cell wall biosynthesis